MTDERARQIIDQAENIKEIIDREVGRLMGEQLTPVQTLLHDVMREVNKAQNHLTALGVGYSRGSLPKKDAP